MKAMVDVTPRAGGGRWPKGLLAGAALFTLLFLPASRAQATAVQGTVQFQGQVQFAAPIAGIALEDVVVSTKAASEGTGKGGEKCEILLITSDNADVGGAYPDAGVVSILIELGVNSPNKDPEGDCIVTLKAGATDGVSVSARGTTTVFVTKAEIETSATIVVADAIVLRESKAIAGLDKECFKWIKKTLKKRAKCNFLILKKGGLIAVDKCKDAGFPEPAMCDPGDSVEAILALGHGSNDQQTDVASGEAVDLAVLNEQVKCQKRFGRQAAVNFAIKRSKRVAKKCVENLIDSETCRDTESKESKRKLDKIDKCVVTQEVDGATGRLVPDVDTPCDVCIDGITGDIDRKCMKGCFQLAIDEFSDIIVGDVPECGNSILQPPEFCDDGNLSNGDCCSASCTVENLGDDTCGIGACEMTVPICVGGAPGPACVPGTPSTEGPALDATCTDGIDNDCDGTTDGADLDCQ